jgi:hypothetical protein
MRTTFKNELFQKAGGIFVLVMIAFGATSLFAEPYIGWIQRYDGPGNGNDVPVKLVADQNGNLYIAGTVLGVGTGNDIVILKYDPKGNLLWERTYNGLANGNEECRTVGLDSNGNIYVIGTGPGLNSSLDYTFIKYDSHGNRLWVVRWNFTSQVWFGDFSVNATGNSYVTGSYNAGGGPFDMDWFISYVDPDGRFRAHPLSHPAPPGIFEDGRRIAAAPDGTMYWHACMEGSCFLQKFGVSGSWVKSTAGLPGERLAIDDKENIYFEVHYLIGDFVTRKYDSSGTLLWVRTYNGPANGSERFSEMVTNVAGNLYVTGLSPGIGTGNDYATVKYDSLGNEVWVRRYDGPSSNDDVPFGIAIGGGNVYVTGGSYADYLTIKYDSAGNQIWVHRYNGPGNSGDVAVDVAADAGGNVWITGRSAGDIVTIKYSPIPILKGDLDENGVLALDDIILLLNCLFLGNGSCPPQFADVNCDAFLTPADVVVLLRSFFLIASPPC